MEIEFEDVLKDGGLGGGGGGRTGRALRSTAVEVSKGGQEVCFKGARTALSLSSKA